MKNLLYFFVFSFVFSAFAGNKDSVLFTYGNQYVTIDEFKMVYDKNNQGKDYSEASLKEYLDLYIKFKLKVQDAIDHGYDTVPRIKEEIEKYKGQLSKSYLNEKEITSNLMEQGYERLKWEVNASHILIKVPQDATPEDTLKAFEKINTLRKKAMKKSSDFGKLASMNSQDPSAAKNKGDLGYFTAFQMVYAFEEKAFNTPVGKVSKPFRTRFGYHIIKVHDKRQSRGKIHVAHLFLKTPKGATDKQKESIKERIDTLYAKISRGASFEKFVLEMSDDKTSAKKGGELRWFGSGEMVKAFEDAAFGLEKNGDISIPVQTSYGWHIIKRLGHQPLASYEELKDQIEKKVKKDSRSNKAEKALIASIKKEFKFKAYPKTLKAFIAKVDSSILTGKWNGKGMESVDGVLFKIKKKNFTEKDFVSFIRGSKKIKRGTDIDQVVTYYFQAFERAVCMNIAKGQLPKKYPEFKALMQEYNDGILLFEITENKVWKKAVEDTTGLEAFHAGLLKKFHPHAEDSNGMARFYKHYMWEPRMKASVYYCKTDSVAQVVTKALENPHDSINRELLVNINTKKPLLKIETDAFEADDNRHIDETKWKIGVSEPFSLPDGRFVVVWNKEVLTISPKLLKEVKGQAISDYQGVLEEAWIASLKEKYPIVIHEELLQNIVQ